MVDLVLEAHAEQPVGRQGLRSTLLVEIAHGDVLGTRDLGIDVGNRQAAFLVDGEALAPGDDLGIDQRDGPALVAVRHIDDGEAPGLADLRRGEADAGGLVHGGIHRRQQGADGVELARGDGTGPGTQGGVRRDQDFQQLGVGRFGFGHAR